MIGQQKIKDMYLKWFKENKLPKVSIINAPQGYGKKEFIKWLSNETNIPYKIFSSKIDDIRNAIKASQNEYTLQFYVFEDFEYNSNSKIIQNSILKLFEEPPKNIYIFLLCTDCTLLLPTIYNRGIKVDFEGYSKEELALFNSNEKALEIFNNPKHLLLVKDIEINDLLDVITKIADKLDLANISNALKLNTYIKTKDNETGYDLHIFFTVLKYVLLDRYYNTGDETILNKFKYIEEALNHIKNNSKYVMDMFLLRNYVENKKWTSKF